MEGRRGTALLVDTGSPGNLVGSEWSEEHRVECQRAEVNWPSYHARDVPQYVGGIGGKASQPADWDVIHTISVGDGRLGTFTAPELPNSKVPALLGQRSMKEKRCLIDTFTGRIYLVGPGGYELKLSPGSVQHDLVESSAGHLMLPCSCFNVPVKPYEEVTSFIVGDYFDGGPARSACKSTGGELPPARNSSSFLSRTGFNDVDPLNKFDGLINRAYDELDMLVESGLSKMD